MAVKLAGCMQSLSCSEWLCSAAPHLMNDSCDSSDLTSRRRLGDRPDDAGEELPLPPPPLLPILYRNFGACGGDAVSDSASEIVL